MTFANRMANFDQAIFGLLAVKRAQMIADGKDVIDLSVGTPDFKPDDHILKAFTEAASDTENFKYSLYDRPFFVEAVQNWYKNRYGVELDTNQIVSTHGSQEGLGNAFFPICDVGDIVLVPNPGYPIFSYGPIIAGAVLHEYSLLAENDFLPDLDAIDPEIAKKAKAMMVSYPSNPSGASADKEFYVKLVAFAKKYDIIIFHDNAYSEIVFTEEPGISFLSVPGAMDVGIEFNSLSKTYNLSGCRIAVAVGNTKIIEMFKKFRSQIDYGIFLPIQYAAAAALNGPQDNVKRNVATYKERSLALSSGLRELGWDCPDAKGTMFVWVPLPKGYTNSVEFAFELLEKTNVICVPGSSFGSLGEGFVRMAMTTSTERIKEAVERIKASKMIG